MAGEKTVLIIDDDADLREALAEQFALEDGFGVITAANAGEGMERVRQDNPDIVIFDVGLPDMDGRDACAALREEGESVPIILLTAQSGDEDHVKGLQSGASDFLAKPIAFRVLLERVRTQLRRYESSEDAVLNIGPYVFTPGMKQLVNQDGKRIRLTEKETSILKYLYRAGGQPVAREELLDRVWGYHREANTHTLETHIYRLRQKIEPDPGKTRLLVTDTGGYRLQA